MNNSITIITHRGLDPDKKNYFKESSLEAFKDQLNRGYGVEFDIQLTKDNKFIISHDKDLSRITNNKDNKNIVDLTLKELLKMNIENSHFISLNDLLDLIKNISRPNTISALHLKSSLQNKKTLDLLIKELKNKDLSKIIIFDILKDTAAYLKEKLKNIKLAPSVAHIYDIERYNHAVGDTLWNIEDVIKDKDLFYAVWLDEWDTLDKNNSNKIFYNQEIFNICRENNLKIFIVSPELHSHSPGLYANESHKDAENSEVLINRIKNIISLNPDAICTDYPDTIKELL